MAAEGGTGGGGGGVLKRKAAAAGEPVLVISGSGYVGQFVIRALLEAGQELHTTHRPGRDVSQLPNEVHCHAVDYTDVEAITALIQELRPGVVVNCGAMGNLGACEKDPAAAEVANCPRALVEAMAAEAEGAPRLFVHLSTDIVFRGDPSELYGEETPPAPVNLYGRLKAEFDGWLAAREAPCCVVLRPTNIVGPQHPYFSTGTKFLQWLDGQLRQDAPVKVFDDEFRNYVWVEDIVAVILKLAADFPGKAPAHRLLHCGGPEALNRVDMAKFVLAAKGYKPTYAAPDGSELPRLVPTPRSSVNLGYESPLCIRFKSARVEEYLGRPFRRVADCIKESVDRI